MSQTSNIFKGTTTVVQVDALADRDGNYQNAATVTLESMVDEKTGQAVSGLTVPLTMSYVAASNGKYEGELAHDLAVVVGRTYRATIQAISGSVRRTWTERAICSEGFQ